MKNQHDCWSFLINFHGIFSLMLFFVGIFCFWWWVGIQFPNWLWILFEFFSWRGFVLKLILWNFPCFHFNVFFFSVSDKGNLILNFWVDIKGFFNVLDEHKGRFNTPIKPKWPKTRAFYFFKNSSIVSGKPGFWWLSMNLNSGIAKDLVLCSQTENLSIYLMN